jgi:capsular polysaccharide biosynthesis protein
MEIARYLNIIKRRWPIILVAFHVTAGATCYFVLPQPDIYESAGTFVVGPRSVNAEESVGALDTLIRGEAINGTYASIARSNSIRKLAEENLDPEQLRGDLNVNAEVLTGTNILSISVLGTHPESVQALAEVVGTETVDYVSVLDEAYKLQPLDAPPLPASPVAPKRSLTIAMGVLFGLVLGMTLALLTDSAMAQLAQVRADGPPKKTREPASATTNGRRRRFLSRTKSALASVDGGRVTVGEPPPDPDIQVTLHGERSLVALFRQKMELAILSESTFSFGLLKLSVKALEGAQDDAPPISAPPALRNEDVFGQMEDGRLVVVLPGLSSAEARAFMLDWEAVAWSSLVASLKSRGAEPRPGLITTAVCVFQAGRFVGDHDAVEVAEMFRRSPSSIDETDTGVGARLERVST